VSGEVLTCSRCGASTSRVFVNHTVGHTDPPGWSCITLTGLPVSNRRLCPLCTGDVRVFLAMPPTALERIRDLEREEAFHRGYQQGTADAAVPQGVAS
jgi:hypothetical protein